MKTLVIIPSRLSATRLPGKPLLKVNGLSIITHVVKKAKSANIGEVYVATEDQEIIDKPLIFNNGLPGNLVADSLDGIITNVFIDLFYNFYNIKRGKIVQ